MAEELPSIGAAAVAAAGAGRRLPAYVVDADEAVRASCATLLGSLGSLGHPERGCASSRAPLAAVDVAAPGRVILDIGTPGIDGLALQQRLQRAVAKAGWYEAGRDAVP